MSGVHDDLATLEDLIAVQRGEIARLREERDGAVEQTRAIQRIANETFDRAEAAEARCARLQQALAWYADENNWTQLASWGGRLYDDEAPGPRDCGKIAREALAGLDTPADQGPYWQKRKAQLLAQIDADSQREERA